MFLKNYQNMFIFFLMTGTVIAVSSNSWMTSWVGLEMNLMSIIPLILSELSFKTTEASIKYFLAQAMASIFLISSSTIQSLQSSISSLEMFNPIIFMALTMKAGMAPFHTWFPQIMEWINWLKCFIILTWQKIAPFILLSCFLNTKLMYMLIIFSSMIGAFGGLNQVNNKLILTYSSITHSSWLLMMISVSLKHWIVYFSVYALTLTPIIFLLFNFKLNLVSEIYSSKMNNEEKMSMSMLMMSLGGLPPLMGFSAKLMTIMSGVKIFSFFIFLIMITSSLISLFFYLKLFFNSLASSLGITTKFFYPEKKINSLLNLVILINLVGSGMVLLT